MKALQCILFFIWFCKDIFTVFFCSETFGLLKKHKYTNSPIVVYIRNEFQTKMNIGKTRKILKIIFLTKIGNELKQEN